MISLVIIASGKVSMSFARTTPLINSHEIHSVLVRLKEMIPTSLQEYIYVFPFHTGSIKEQNTATPSLRDTPPMDGNFCGLFNPSF